MSSIWVSGECVYTPWGLSVTLIYVKLARLVPRFNADCDCNAQTAVSRADESRYSQDDDPGL